MRSGVVEVIAFTSDDVSAVVQKMRQLEESGDGSNWVNIAPGRPGDRINDPPRQTPLEKWFSGRGPKVPMATWTPPSTGHKSKPGAVGVEHGAGPNALARLTEAGVPLPDGWRKLQDHAMRGIVVEPPPGTGCDEVISWLLTACRQLCIPDTHDHWSDTDDHWIAEFHCGALQ